MGVGPGTEIPWFVAIVNERLSAKAALYWLAAPPLALIVTSIVRVPFGISAAALRANSSVWLWRSVDADWTDRETPERSAGGALEARHDRHLRGIGAAPPEVGAQSGDLLASVDRARRVRSRHPS